MNKITFRLNHGADKLAMFEEALTSMGIKMSINKIPIYSQYSYGNTSVGDVLITDREITLERV